MKYLIFLLPLLFDLVLYGVFFIISFLFASRTGSGLLTASPMVVWGVVYAFAALIFGRITTAKNAGRLLLTSGILVSAVSLLLFIFNGIYISLVWIFMLGVIAGCFCVPFQIFSDSMTGSSSPERTASLYIASVSIGPASGPLVFGLLPMKMAYLICIVCGILISAIAFCIMRKIKPAPKEQVMESGKPVLDNRMKSVWVFVSVCACIIAAVNVLSPCIGTGANFSKSTVGITMAAGRIAQAAGALALIKAAWQMRSCYFIPAIVPCGVAGLLLFTGSGLAFFAAANIVFGIFGGLVTVHLVFSALDRDRFQARFVGVNELIMGIGVIAGSLASGAALEKFSAKIVLLVMSAMIITSGAAAFAIHKTQQKGIDNGNIA